MDVIVKDIDILEDRVTDWQDVTKKNDCKSCSQKTQSWRKIAKILVHYWCTAEETTDRLFGKEADVAAADIDGHVGENGREDARDGADTEERALLPILIILEVELLEISEQADDC